MQEEQIVSSEAPSNNPPARAEPRDYALTPTQEQALQQLAAGKGIVSVARSVGVHRRTIARWLRSDPHFAAAYNAWRKETVASGQARLLAMADMALDTVQSAVLGGNARVAVQVAKATGVMDAPKPGLTEPARLYRRKRLRDAKWQKELADAELHEAFNKRSRESHRHPSHCEYMIDCYIRCRTEALRAESPDNRARRLEEQPKSHRNYLPITLRLFAMLDAEAAAAATPAAPEAPSLAGPSSAPVPPPDPAASTAPNANPALSPRDDDADDDGNDEQSDDDFADKLAKFF